MGLKDRRLREKEQRRQQILDAARAMVLQYGVTAVSIQQIAKKAELSVGTIYLYFENKEEIFATLQEDVLDLLYEKISTAIKSIDDPREKIRQTAYAYNIFSIKYKQYFDIINYFLAPTEIIFPPNLKEKIDTHGNKILSLIVQAIEEGAKAGYFDTTNAKKCAVVLWGTIHGLLQFRKLKNTILKNDDFDEIYNYSVECFIKGLSKKTIAVR